MKSIPLLPLVLLLLSFQFTVAQEALTIDKKSERVVQKLLKNKQLQSAFETIVQLEGKTQERLIELTEIEAPPFKEEKRAKRFADYFTTLGLDSVWIDEVGNVLGLMKGTEGNKTVALDAHLDTVFPEGTEVTVRIKKDTLFAPGIGDDTRGLSMVLTIIESIRQNSIRPKDHILFV
ncbi:MAG: M20/M25/M40 family metallo-hydrolase, partial [Flavobacteriaceae bacterium]